MARQTCELKSEGCYDPFAVECYLASELWWTLMNIDELWWMLLSGFWTASRQAPVGRIPTKKPGSHRSRHLHIKQNLKKPTMLGYDVCMMLGSICSWQNQLALHLTEHAMAN
jgi:hypothetical protein